MSNIHYTRTTHFRRLLLAVLTLNFVILRFLYIPFTLYPPHSNSSMLNAYQLHRTSSEGHKVLVEYEQMFQYAHIT
jgi:hypothetical protein